jgi:hypothetical protein
MARRSPLNTFLKLITPSTKRPQLQCFSCGYTWYPRGSNRSRKCPACGRLLQYVENAETPPDFEAFAKVFGAVVIAALIAGAGLLGLLFFLAILGSSAAPPERQVTRPRSRETRTQRPSARQPPTFQPPQPEPEDAQPMFRFDLLPLGPADVEPAEEVPSPVVYHTFTSADGRFTVEAELLYVAFGKAKLCRRDNGNEIEVPLERFTAEDQEWIMDELWRRRELRENVNAR